MPQIKMHGKFELNSYHTIRMLKEIRRKSSIELHSKSLCSMLNHYEKVCERFSIIQYLRDIYYTYHT